MNINIICGVLVIISLLSVVHCEFEEILRAGECASVTGTSVTLVADSDTSTCTGYVICVPDGSGSFSEVTGTCADGTCFDSASQGCASSSSKCTRTGQLIPDTDESTDTGYLVCIQNFADNTFTTTAAQTCPDGTIFDEAQQGCITAPTTVTGQTTAAAQDTTVASDATTAANGATTAASGDTTAANTDAVTAAQTTTVATASCTTTGNVADPNDCTAYVSCTVNSDGTISQTSYPCNTGSCWDSDAGACTTDCSNCNFNTGTGGGATGTCTSAGEITNPSNCRQYISCVQQSDGSFTSTTYSCPGSSCFSPTSLTCSFDCSNCARRKKRNFNSVFAPSGY